MRGGWAVESITDAPDVVFASGAVVVAGDRNGNVASEGELHIIDGRPMNKEWLVRVREVVDRDVADIWRGRYLLVDTALLPPANDDELYVASLIGMQVQVHGKGVVGSISDVYEAPQGLIIEVDTGKGTKPLVPWHPELIHDLNEEARVVTIAHLEGLLD